MIQDIGGGWPLDASEDSTLSYVPLVWMVREAQRAGLFFDEAKLRALNCYLDDAEARRRTTAVIPSIEVDAVSPSSERGISPLGHRLGASAQPSRSAQDAHASGAKKHARRAPSELHPMLHAAATRGRIRDVLQFRNGAPWASVASWNLMEYLPFRRMDLQHDGTWKSIRWPLPKSEVRYMPNHAVVHASVLRRMEADPAYRPSNLIVGGRGRGVRRAPDDYGMGAWLVVCEEGDDVGEVVVRARRPEIQKNGEGFKPIAVAPTGPQGMFLSGKTTSKKRGR